LWAGAQDLLRRVELVIEHNGMRASKSVSRVSGAGGARCFVNLHDEVVGRLNKDGKHFFSHD